MIDQLQSTRGDQAVRYLGIVGLLTSGDDLTPLVAINLKGYLQRNGQYYLLFSVETRGGYKIDDVRVPNTNRHEIEVDIVEDKVTKTQVAYYEVLTDIDLSSSFGWQMTYYISAASASGPRRRSTWVYTKATAFFSRIINWIIWLWMSLRDALRRALGGGRPIGR